MSSTCARARWSSRPKAPGVEHALAAIGRDRRYGGGLLAGALAFRLFGALLPFALLLAVLLGYAATVERDTAEEAADATGISEARAAVGRGLREAVERDALGRVAGRAARAGVGGDLGGARDPRRAQHRLDGRGRADGAGRCTAALVLIGAIVAVGP